MNLIAVDPGRVAGVAVLRDRRTLGRPPGFESFEAPWMDAMEKVERILVQSRGLDVAIACEAFTITPRTARNTRQNDALEMIGAVRYVARVTGAEFWLQQPAERKIAKKQWLKDRNWWFPTPDNHRNDAAAHLFVLALRLRHIDPKELL